MAAINNMFIMLCLVVGPQCAAYFVKGKVSYRGMNKRGFYTQGESGGYPMLGRRSSPPQPNVGSLDLSQIEDAFKRAEPLMSAIYGGYPRVGQHTSGYRKRSSEDQYATEGSEGSEGSSHNVPVGATFGDLFEAFDTNGDLALSEEEFMAGFDKLRGDNSPLC